MFHELGDLREEQQRVAARPPEDGAPPVLSVFDVVLHQDVDPTAYMERVRAVVSAALKLAVSATFDDEDLPVEAIPAWFVAVSRTPDEPGEPGEPGEPDADLTEFARRGKARYQEEFGNRPWDIQWWLWQFDPDSETRGWAWWDATQSGDRRVRVWADSWGEDFYACDEVRWLLHTAGAETVSGPVLAHPSEWVTTSSPAPGPPEAWPGRGRRRS
ncbi:hypothetical protein AB0I10_15030 [Streptomyces sp. NPDC050636]|uniref:hypothetical protein n=1 Tax=Streptomyces sp. NPDC050636 TaxID=3154510 RepID=UPI003420824B